MKSISHSRAKLHKVERARKAQQAILATCAVLAVIGIIICGYGHAAVSSNVYISGEATIKRTGTNFTSTYMQDVTPAECAAVENDAEKQLIDKRDGKKYWVIKLRDGSCWMTQDLKYNIVADENGKVELTSELTDINPDNVDDDYYEYRIGANGEKIWLWNENSWLPPTETYMYVKGNTGQGANTTFSWNRGDWVMKKAVLNNKARIWVIDEDENGNEYQAYQPSNSLPPGVTYDEETKTYNPHYLSGNYYQYNTATAGGRVSKNHPISSICPRGWTLPRTPDQGGMFSVAMTLYSSGEVKSVFSWPLYFSEIGYHLNGNVDFGEAYYWESWFRDYQNVFSLVSGTVWPGTVKNRSQYWGIPVRCQVRGAGPSWETVETS